MLPCVLKGPSGVMVHMSHPTMVSDGSGWPVVGALRSFGSPPPPVAMAAHPQGKDDRPPPTQAPRAGSYLWLRPQAISSPNGSFHGMALEYGSRL
jgi:hypothetical protein